jgi:predicted lactoylglutathione lyase
MKFSTVALGVADLGAAERFYAEGLGLAIDSRPQPDLVYLASGETRIALYPAKALADYAGVVERPAGGVVLSLNVESPEEVEAILDRCVRAGGELIRPGGHMEWGGHAGTVADPDGHVWEIVCAG